MQGKCSRKYWIRFDNCEVEMSRAIQITAKDYYQQLAFFKEVVEKTKDDENCGQAFCKTLEPLKKEHSTVYIDYLGFGTATTYLYCEVLDEGYCFKHRRG